MEIGRYLMKMFALVAIIVFIFTALIFGSLTWALSNDDIESDHIIEPEIRTIDGDTIYIYHKK